MLEESVICMLVALRSFFNSKYIVLNAGTSDGFIDGTKLVSSYKMRNADCYGEINRDNFLELCAIIMHNASTIAL